ncbi:MAG: DinB family protein [Spirochaetia bacterium]|nr:DinB family protein [Spirochaetia bacterium]
MKEAEIYIEQHKFIRKKLLDLLDEISSSEFSEESLHWMMPFGNPGRAHISWQFMHCAATLDRYLNARILSGNVKDEKLVNGFAGGSIPDPAKIIAPDEIRMQLEKTTEPYFQYFLSLEESRLSEMPNPDAGRTHREILQLLNWHEAHHHGQCQIIWNSFRNKSTN